jgi:predicted secreted protein
MKKMIWLFVLLLLVSAALAEEQEIQVSPVLMLECNRTTGFDWSWEIDRENVVDVACEYVVNWHPESEEDIMPPGVGGCCNITLTGLAPGAATITFTYRRPWEEKEPLYTLVYRVSVNEQLNVTILSSAFVW